MQLHHFGNLTFQAVELCLCPVLSFHRRERKFLMVTDYGVLLECEAAMVAFALWRPQSQLCSISWLTAISGCCSFAVMSLPSRKTHTLERLLTLVPCKLACRPGFAQWVGPWSFPACYVPGWNSRRLLAAGVGKDDLPFSDGPPVQQVPTLHGGQSQHSCDGHGDCRWGTNHF